MKITLALLFCIAWGTAKAQTSCNLTTEAKQKEFPDLTKKGQLSYQLSVEFTMSSKEINQTDFIKECYDIIDKRGRLDVHSNNLYTKYYYYTKTNETFNITGDNCGSFSLESIPDYHRITTDWEFGDVRGPSAMFLTALNVWKTNRRVMNYMGESEELIRGLKAQYWRRCKDDQTIDYYFTVDEHDDAFGDDKLKQIPLRALFGPAPIKDKAFFPQNYDVIAFQPFVSDEIKTLAVPTGVGCLRNDSLKDVPTVPDFSGGNLLTFGEASYIYSDQDDTIWNYYSTFMYAQDFGIDHIAFFYTPWGSVDKGGKQTPLGYVHVNFDTKHKYVYAYDLVTDTCTISRDKEYSPRYYIPKSGGYIDLTDNTVLFPNNELSYMADGIDRGFDVHIFERIVENYPLGNRTIPKVFITNNYLRESEVIDNIVEVKNTSMSVNMKFFRDVAKAHTEELTLNFYGFTTQVEYKQWVFNVAKCLKNNDESMWITLGFPADQKVMDKVVSQIPAIKNNILETITRDSELNALRIPTILVDFEDLIYIRLLILEKPPIMLDYLDPESDKSIDSTVVEGIISEEGCAAMCLESGPTCWGFGHCGETCYLGVEAATVTPKTGCKLFKRFNNDTSVPSKDNVAASLRKVVEDHEMKLAIPTTSDIPNEAPVFLEATFFDMTTLDEGDKIFGLMGKETNPRLRVIKAGYKLDKSGDGIRNFGKLRYDECQRLCLDYKRCETVSYCVTGSECVLSTIYGEDLPKDKIKEDNFCNLLTRKYADHFDRSAGNVLSTTAAKLLDKTSPEDCARACMKETSFECLSFDLCPSTDKGGCRLHKVHLADVTNQEAIVSNQSACGHYSKKFSYDFKREPNKKSVGTGIIISRNITLEQCARRCMQYEGGVCYGYDFCADEKIGSTSCSILNDNPTKFKTTYSAVCSHYLQGFAMAEEEEYTQAKVAWVGVVTFFVAAVFGVLLTFGIAYYRANRQTS